MKNGSILFVDSPFRFKTLFTKPLKYVIQIFTRDGSEHAASYCDGKVFNMSGEGGHYLTFDDWIKEYKINGAKIHAWQPLFEIPEDMLDKLRAYNDSCVGIKYDAFGAVMSVVDSIDNIDYTLKGQFCSEQALTGLIKMGATSDKGGLASPRELKKVLARTPLYSKNWRRVNELV